MPIGEKNVEESIIVIVQKTRTPTEKWNCHVRHAGSEAYIGKAGVSVVAVQRVVVVGEIRDAEVDSSVAVVIADRNPHSGLFSTLVIQSESREVTDVLERAVMLVVVEVFRDGIIRNQQVNPAVIIDINEHRGKAIVAPGVGDARLHTYIREGAIVVVVKQMIALPRQSARTTHDVDPSKLAEFRRQATFA